MRNCAGYLPLLLLFSSACAHAPRDEQAVPAPLRPGDARRALVGTWQLSVEADTMRGLRDTSTGIQMDTLTWKVGTFRITDTLLARSRQEVRAVLTPGFDELVPLAAGSWALNGPPPVALGGTAIALNHRKRIWEIDLSPNLFDVSLSLNGQLWGDSLVGTWSQRVMGALARSGRFVMRRTSKSR